MITKYKIFENNFNEVGYYVIPKLVGINYDDYYKKLISGKIFKIIGQTKSTYKIDFFDQYHDKDNAFWINKEHAEYKSRNREELEHIISANKYNL